MATTDRLGATVDATDAPSSSTPNAGLAIKTAARAATTGSNINLQTIGLGIIDGVQLVAGDRVLVKDQTDQTTNGVYNASSGVWAASSDFQNNTQLAQGLQVFVLAGTANGMTSWALTTANPIVLGTSHLTFASAIGANALATSGIAPFHPPLNPSSGNLQGNGVPQRHQLVWSDTNPVFWADVMELNSVDPSAIATITVSGTAANGTLALSFTYGSTTVPVVVSVTAGQTTAQVASAIVAAIQANATLFTPASPTRNGGGGYDLGGQIGYVTTIGSEVLYDYNVLNSTQISYTAGTTGITLTFGAGQSTASTNYSLPTALDNNPVLGFSRNPGVAPPSGSTVGAIEFNGSQSSSPAVLTVQYGSLGVDVISSTTGNLSSRFFLITPSATNVLNQGLYVGAGAYTVGVSDKGVDSLNAKTLWVNGSEELSLQGTVFNISSAAGHSIQLAPGNGGAVVAQSGADVGLTIFGDVAHIQELSWQDAGAIRWSAYKPASSTDLRFFDGTADRLVLKNGGEIDVKTGPLNLGTSGTTVGQLNFFNATTGFIALQPTTGALGSAVLTIPAVTDTLAAIAATQTLTNKTISGASNTLTVRLASDVTGNLPVGNLNSGTSATGATFWRGDGVWASTPGAGALTFLTTLTASNSASLSDTTHITNTYTSYLLVFQNIVPATNEKILQLQIHSGGAFKATGYLTNQTLFGASGLTGSQGATTYIPLTFPSDASSNALANSAPGFSGQVILTNPAASAICLVDAKGVYLTGGGTVGNTLSGGFWNTAAPVDGFQALMDSGNITSGQILIYGIS